MLVEIVSVEPVYIGNPGAYRITVAFANRGSAVFTQIFVVPPKPRQVWEMPEPRLELFKQHADGSPR